MLVVGFCGVWGGFVFVDGFGSFRRVLVCCLVLGGKGGVFVDWVLLYKIVIF